MHAIIDYSNFKTFIKEYEPTSSLLYIKAGGKVHTVQVGSFILVFQIHPPVLVTTFETDFPEAIQVQEIHH